MEPPRRRLAARACATLSLVEQASNISERLIVLRLRRSVVLFAVGLLMVGALHHFGVDLAWYGLVALPFFGAINLAFQGIFKTCTYMAARGMRDLGEGQERVADREEQAALRARGRRIQLMSLAVTLAATVLTTVAARG